MGEEWRAKKCKKERRVTNGKGKKIKSFEEKETVDMATIGEPSRSKAPAPPSSSPSLLPPPPPADAESVTPCGGVLKSVLKKGAEGADRPPLHSRCLGEKKRAVFFFPFLPLSLSSQTSLSRRNRTPKKTIRDPFTTSALRGTPPKLGRDVHQVCRRREGHRGAGGGGRRARFGFFFFLFENFPFQFFSLQLFSLSALFFRRHQNLSPLP